MPCDHCQVANKQINIKLPAHLRKAIAFATDRIEDGTLRQSSYKPRTCVDACPGLFSTLVKSGKWEDIVDYYFECTKCNQLYNLSAETYHGSGGSWSIAERDR